MSKKRERITLTEEECVEIRWEGSYNDYETVRGEKINYFDTEKGSTKSDIIIMRKSDGKLFKMEVTDYGRGNIEYETSLVEVFAKNIKTIIYE